MPPTEQELIRLQAEVQAIREQERDEQEIVTTNDN